MSNGYRVRPATLDDWSNIVALDQKIFGEYGAQEEPAIIRSRLLIFPQGCVVLESHSMDVPAAAETLGYGARQSSGRRFMAGYLTTEKWDMLREPTLDEDPRETHQPDGRVLHITTLAVDPTCQNQGLGTRLLDHAVAIARREACLQIILETARAEQFYLRHGFRRVYERIERGIKLTVMLLDL